MTWQQFKNYLETKILQEEEETHALRPVAKTKYAINSEQELILILTNLIASIDNMPYNSFSNSYSYLNEQDSDYYSLPDLDDLYNEDGLKTWPQLFPKRAETHFGKKQDIEVEITSATWKVLEKIFADWTITITRAERLKDALGEDELMGKFLLEAAVSLNYELIKRKGYDKKLQEWIKEYNLLEKEEQKQLSKQKEMAEKLLKALEEESQTRQEQVWYQKINWKKYGLVGGISLAVVFVIIWVIKIIRKVIS